MSRSTHIVTDLGFGDAGKGTTVDALARRCSSPPLVVRHNGGAQAGHNVVTSDGRQHVFSQFGAATFVPGSKTLLSKHFVLHPGGLMAENDHLVSIGVADALERLIVDERALVITPYHQAMNRLREAARGILAHGTCGLGVGETVGDSLEDPHEAMYASDLHNTSEIRRKLLATRDRKLQQIEPLLSRLAPTNPDLALLRNPDMLERTTLAFRNIGRQIDIACREKFSSLIRSADHVIFEGAQGVLLDEWHGFHPHTTWSTTTSANADTMILEANRSDPVHRIGVVRAYATRHGQGPFPTENTALTEQLRDAHNTDSGWQGRFRCGWFDVPLTRYALSCSPAPIDSLAVTCLDRLKDSREWKICTAYDQKIDLRSKPGDLQHQEQITRALSDATPVLHRVSNNYADTLEDLLRLPISMMSFGPTAEDKTWL